MKVKIIPGPMFDQKKKEAQSYIQKRAIEIYRSKKKQPKPSA